MRVLHIIPSISPVCGGTSRAVLDIVLALRQAGVEAEIATTNDHGLQLLPIPLKQRTEYQQVPVYLFPKLSVGPCALQEFNFSISLTTWLWQNITNYDLVHVHMLFSYPATVAMRISRFRNVPYITTPHGLLCHWSLQQSTRKKQLFMTLIERKNLVRSQLLHVTAEKEKAELAALKLGVKSFVLPLGLYMPNLIANASEKLRQRLGIFDDAPIILFLGRLHYKKGLDYLISALGRLQHIPFHFVLAGSGSQAYELELKTLLKAASIEDRSYRLGFVSGELKDIILQGADLFALSSHSENFGIAVLEALAAGLPVILTPGVALSEMVAAQQLGYVSKLDVDNIYHTLTKALEINETTASMGQRASQFVRSHYTWDKTAQQLIQTYTAIVEKIKVKSPVVSEALSVHSTVKRPF